MYHPTRAGVRGGRDQFSWDDVKVDKHRENYLGHSIKAPVGRWQKGKDLHWYNRDKKSDSDAKAMKEEISRIKKEEEQAMREALGLAPKRATRSQGNRLEKHEFAELVKRGSTAQDLGAGHAEAAQVNGLGFARGGPTHPLEESSLPSSDSVEKINVNISTTSTRNDKEESEDESNRNKRKREEKKRVRHEKRHPRDSDDKKKRSHKKDKERRRHDSD